MTVVRTGFPGPPTTAKGAVKLATVGNGGGGGGAPFSASFVIKASPQKIFGSPLKTLSKAFGVVKKSADRVSPVTYTFPAESSLRSVP